VQIVLTAEIITRSAISSLAANISAFFISLKGFFFSFLLIIRPFLPISFLGISRSPISRRDVLSPGLSAARLSSRPNLMFGFSSSSSSPFSKIFDSLSSGISISSGSSPCSKALSLAASFFFSFSSSSSLSIAYSKAGNFQVKRYFSP